ncbi:hypothetical protein ACIO9K_24740, partial [Kitasatospora sp. NPDC087271]
MHHASPRLTHPPSGVPRRGSAGQGRVAAILVLALIVGLLQALAVTQGAPAVAAMDSYKAATFNMQNQDRWDRDRDGEPGGGNLEANLLNTNDAPDVVALQEVGSTVPCPANPQQFVTRGRSLEGIDTDIRTEWTVTKCEQPFAIARDYDLFFLPSRSGNATRNLGFVVRHSLAIPLDINNVHVIGPALNDQGVEVANNPKPMLGIRLPDGTWFYSVHGSNAVNDRNDTANRIAAAKADARLNSWTVLGDFNRTAASWVGSPDLGTAHVVDSDGATYPAPRPDPDNGSGKNLDYAISSSLPVGYTGFRLTNLYSDHHAVLFEPYCDPAQPVARSIATRGKACSRKPPAVVSMGDSYISGEGGRWAGNANTSPSGDVWGTDRKAD